MFSPHKLYIQIAKNKVTVINLVTGERVTRVSTTPFSTHRVVLGSFGPANETIAAGLRDLEVKRGFGGIKVVIHQIEGAEGGLSDIEKRALRDLAEMAGANKVLLIEDEKELSSGEALTRLDSS